MVVLDEIEKFVLVNELVVEFAVDSVGLVLVVVRVLVDETVVTVD